MQDLHELLLSVGFDVNEVKEKIDKSKDKDQLLLLVQRENGKFYVPLEQQG